MTPAVDDNPFAAVTSRTVGRHPAWKPVVRTLVLLACCGAAVWGLQWASRYWLLQTLTENLEQHGPKVQRERLAMLGELGSEAVPSLVDLLAAKDDRLAKAAWEELAKFPGRAGEVGSSGRTASYAALVQSLQEVAEQLPSERQSWVVRMLDGLLRDVTPTDDDRSQAIWMAAHEFRSRLALPNSTTADSAEPVNLASRPLSAEPAATGLPGPMRPLPIRLDDEALQPLDEGLTLGPFPARPGTIGRRSGVPTDSTNNQGLRPSQRSGSLTAPPRQSLQSPSWQPPHDPSADNGVQPTDPPQLLRPPANVIATSMSAAASEAISQNPFSTYATRELVSLVASVQPHFRSAAVAELKHRGFAPGDLELATRLASNDARVRMEMIPELKIRDDVDVVQWLLWLAADTERDVRLDAIAVLGTIPDRRISPALREQLQRERDAAVAGRIRRLLQIDD